jgi:hypothetical protein
MGPPDLLFMPFGYLKKEGNTKKPDRACNHDVGFFGNPADFRKATPSIRVS